MGADPVVVDGVAGVRLTDEEVAALPPWTRALRVVLTDQERFALASARATAGRGS
jgi:hypothetical protein